MKKQSFEENMNNDKDFRRNMYIGIGIAVSSMLIYWLDLIQRLRDFFSTFSS